MGRHIPQAVHSGDSRNNFGVYARRFTSSLARTYRFSITGRLHHGGLSSCLPPHFSNHRQLHASGICRLRAAFRLRVANISPAPRPAEHTLMPSPQTVHIGYFLASIKPVLSIEVRGRRHVWRASPPSSHRL